MANKETRIYKTDTLEKLRQKSNEISLHLGDNEQLNALMADKTYIYSASAGQTLFAGPDTSSPAKTSRFETSPAHTIDNTAGYIILESVSSLAASYVQDAVIYQGTSGTPTWQGYIVSATTDKILVRDSSGTFSTTADLKVGASSPDTVAAVKIIRIVIESYPVAIARVYNGGTELTQGMGPNGFHSVNIKATITQTGSPTLTNYTEGVTIYQGDSQATQALVESNSTWYGTLHSVSGGVIRVKTYNGTFSASTLIRALGSSDTITGTNHGVLVPVDSTYGSYVQLTTPAASSNQIKVFSLDVVAAINELQDDIGTVESLTTAANDLVLAINEHDAELGTITAGAMGTTASTVSTAIAEHETQIGNVDITGISGSNDTITGALEQLHGEVGNVTSGNLGTSASNLTSAVREHEDQIGNENITSIDSGSNTITGALNQLHTEVGDLALHTTSTDLTEAINELEEDLFNGEGGTKRTRTSLLTTDKTSIVDSINELHSELFVDGTGVSFTGLSADFFKEAVEELRTELGNHAVLDTNVNTDAVSAINELENVLRDDTTQRTGYVMGTDANNIVAAINEIETVLRGTNANYTINTAAQNVRDALNEHESQIGNMVFGTGGPVDAANSTDLSGAVRVLDAEIGDTSYTGADLTTAIKNTQDDILVAGSLTTLNTDAKFIQGAINEIEGVFDASTHEITAGTNAFNVTSGHFTIDANGVIYNDSHTGTIAFMKAGTIFATLIENSGDLRLTTGSGNTTLLTASGANATFANDLTVTNDLQVTVDLNVDGLTTLDGTTIDGDLDLNGSVDVSTNAVIHGTTELNSTLGVDGNLRVGSNKFNVTAATGNTQIDGTLEVDGTAGVDGNFRVGSNKFNVTASSGNTQIDGTLNVDSTTTLNGTTIDGDLDLNGSVDVSTNATIHGILDVDGVSNLDVVDIDGAVNMASTLQVDNNTNIGGTLGVTGLFTGSALDISGNIDVDGITNLDVVDIDGAVDMATTLQVGGVSTFLDNASVAGNFSVNGNTTLGNQSTDTVAIPGDLTITGNLVVNGSQTTLSTTTLEVEDVLVLVGSDLGNSAEPTTGGFGLETRLFSGAAGVTYNGRTWDGTGKHPDAASNVTGTHSIVYNFAMDQWEADGSLILSSASLGSPDVKVNNGSSIGDLESSNSLDFIGTAGLTVAGAKVGTDYNITFTNSDKGSSQHIWKTITADTGSVAANSNTDSLAFTTGADLTTSISGDSVVISHDNNGTAGTYGITGTQNGQYIKSIITNARGHVTGVTSGQFDTRYQATNPYWVLQKGGVQVDQVGNTDTVNFVEGVGIDIASSFNAGVSTITVKHQDTSSVTNLTSSNSSNTFIQDIDFDFDTFGHVTSATVSTGTVSVGNGTFTVSGSSGLSGSGSMTANQSGNSSAGLTNTDKGSSQNIFKNIAVRNLADSILGTVVADNNNDTIYLDEGNSGITLSVNAGSDHISINHADTSSAGSVNNSGRTYIQDIYLDTYGHITAISSATESYVYTPPTYAGDDINIDTGALTGATVISDLDFNITTNTLGHVTDANATIATRNLTLTDLGFVGWDVEVNGLHKLDVGNNTDVDFKNGNHTTATWTVSGNRIQWDHNTFTSGGTFVGGNDNGIVIESFYYDSYGHLRNVATRDLDSRYDNYYDWNLTADSGGTASITSNATVDIAGGNHISTVRSGNTVTANFVDPGYLLTSNEKTATLDVQGNGTNPYVRLNDGTSDHVQVVGSGTVTVTGSESLDRITITGTDTNTDINVNDANLRTRLAGLHKDADASGSVGGVVYIGDGGNDLDLRIRGNLTITGTTTSVNTTNLNIADNFMVVNSDYPNQAPTEDAGIEVERGSYTNAFLKWNESSNRWNQTIGDTSMTYYNMSIAPDNADQTSFVIRDDSNSTVTITQNEVLAVDGGTAIGTNFVTVNSGESHRLEVSHSNVTHTDTTSANTTLAHSGQFSVVSGVDVNAQGHVTQVITKPYTLPAGSVPNNATITIAAGTDLSTGGAFTTDQSFNETITVNHSNITRSNTTSSDTPNSHNDTFTVIDSITSNGRGHITGVNTKTVRFPASDNTDNNQLTTFQVEDGDGTEVTISHGKEWKFLEGNDINVNWTDTTPGSDADPFDLQFSHKDTTRTNTTTTSAPGYGGTFTAISAVTSNARGHVTGVQTKTVTIPASDNTDERYTFDCVQNTGSNNNPYLKVDGSTENPQYVLMNGGSNVTVTRTSDAALTISATDNDTTYSQSFVDNGANVIHRLTAGGSGSGSDDLQYVPGGIVTLTPSADNMTISAPGTNITVTQTVGSGDLVEINSSTGNNGVMLVASSLYAGLMSKADKVKLGTIATSANNYSLPSDIRNTVRYVGATSSIANMYIDLGLTSRISFYQANGTEEFRMTNGGDFHADGDIAAFSTTTASDAKLKTNIKTVENALDKVCQLDGVTFDWIKDGKESAGVIAQNVEEVLPRAVKEVEDLKGDDSHKVVDYNQLSALFIEAIKELKEENKLLRAEIESLKDINN
jgi:hypothetical protein